MTAKLYNRHERKTAGSIDEPPQELLRNTLGLVNASVEDACRYGGEVTRAALGAMNLRNNRKHLLVDVKVHMLMPGFFAAIPGWHCDGVPRGPLLNPLHKGLPNEDAQETLDSNGRGTHFHMLVTGKGCLTRFLTDPVVLDLPAEGLYSAMDVWVENGEYADKPVRSCQVAEFDWWDIHTGVAATEHEWRYFIRVTETDLAEPERDLRKVIRTQHQVYTPSNFGW